MPNSWLNTVAPGLSQLLDLSTQAGEERHTERGANLALGVWRGLIKDRMSSCLGPWNSEGETNSASARMKMMKWMKTAHIATGTFLMNNFSWLYAQLPASR